MCGGVGRLTNTLVCVSVTNEKLVERHFNLFIDILTCSPPVSPHVYHEI
jgi:N-acetylmuramic acid 6-phosphate (MurNAc-6-P) etherase